MKKESMRTSQFVSIGIALAIGLMIEKIMIRSLLSHVLKNPNHLHNYETYLMLKENGMVE